MTPTLLGPLQHSPSFDDGSPPFDHDVARQLVGKRVLIGMTFAAG
jgi:hypothetical protein